MKPTWLSAKKWRSIQAAIPILCIDVLPVQFCKHPPFGIRAVGLILRETPHQGRRWCLIGGRLLYGESLLEGIRRQIHQTLGSKIRALIESGHQPLFAAEYSPSGTRGFALDPRQHSVGLTYAVEIRGVPTPQGEAMDYEWFDIDRLPTPQRFGFNQNRVVRSCLKLLTEQVGTRRGVE